MRTNNKLNDEDRQVLNGLKITAAYIFTVLAAGFVIISILNLIVK